MTQPATPPAQTSAARVVIACLLATLAPLSLIGGILLASTRDPQYLTLAITLFGLGACLPLIAGLLFNDVRVQNLQRRKEEAQAYNQTASTSPSLQPQKKTGKDWWLQKVPGLQLVGHSLFMPILILQTGTGNPLHIIIALGFSLALTGTLIVQAKADQKEEEQRSNGSYVYPQTFGHTVPRLTASPKKPLKKLAWSTPIALSLMVFVTIVLFINTWSGINLLLVFAASFALTGTLIYQVVADKRRNQNELRRIYLGEDS